MDMARQMMGGTNTMMIKPSRQLVVSMSAATPDTIIIEDRRRIIPMLVKRRTASTSAVALDIRFPVCCWS